MTTQEKIDLLNKLNEEVAILLEQPKKDFVANVNWVSRHSLGQCRKNALLGTNEIRISRFIVSDSTIKNTMLHELCHLYAPIYEHHSGLWLKYARDIGTYYDIKINRLANPSESQEIQDNAKITSIAKIYCPKCGATHYIYKRMKLYYHPEWFRCRNCHSELQIERYR